MFSVLHRSGADYRTVNHPVPLLGVLGALTLFAAGTVVGEPQERGEEEAPKQVVSLVARSSVELRAYFREGRGKAFDDRIGDTLMNRMLDDQIDDFVRRLIVKNRQLEEHTQQLALETDLLRRKGWLKKIRQTASDLEGTLRIWSDVLRPQNRQKTAENPALPSDEALFEQVALYEKQIQQFLFPDEVAVSVVELRSEGFHGTLKKIQRMAEALEGRR